VFGGGSCGDGCGGCDGSGPKRGSASILGSILDGVVE
jgi:hypothetical protein